MVYIMAATPDDSIPPPLPPSLAPSPRDEEIPYQKRLDLAYQAWKIAADIDQPLEINPTARVYGVNPATLRGRCNGAISADDRRINIQKLSPEEEQALVKWIVRL